MATIHTRHTVLAFLTALILLAMAAVSAHAQDFSTYTGAELYKRFCASCHGTRAHGDGPVAKTLRISVPDLTHIAQRHGGKFPDEQIRRIVDGQTVMASHGSRDMPVWGFEFHMQNEDAGNPDPRQRTTEIIQRLTDYLRSIQSP